MRADKVSIAIFFYWESVGVGNVFSWLVLAIEMGSQIPGFTS